MKVKMYLQYILTLDYKVEIILNYYYLILAFQIPQLNPQLLQLRVHCGHKSFNTKKEQVARTSIFLLHNF